MPNRHTNFLAIPITVNGLVKAKHLQDTTFCFFCFFACFFFLHMFCLHLFTTNKIGASYGILWSFAANEFHLRLQRAKSPLAQQFGRPLPAAGCLVHAATPSWMCHQSVNHFTNQSLNHTTSVNQLSTSQSTSPSCWETSFGCLLSGYRTCRTEEKAGAVVYSQRHVALRPQHPLALALIAELGLRICFSNLISS